MAECPYCSKQCEARGLRNHVRLSSGDGHGERGDVPDSFESDLSNEDAEAVPDDDTEAEPSEADESVSQSSDAIEVTAEDLTAPEDTEADSGESEASDDSDEYPFDPDDEDAIRLDGDEQLFVRHNGEVVEATPDDGDYLLLTGEGPILWEADSDRRFEVVTS